MDPNSAELHAVSAQPPRSAKLGGGIYAIVDGETLGWPAAPDDPQLIAVVRQSAEFALAAAQAGAVAVQLRYKAATSAAQTACARAMIRAVGSALPIVVNDDIAVALAVGSGLHLGQTDGDLTAARCELGDLALLGWSTHDLDQIDKANQLPMDYCGFGPVRSTASKRNPEPETGWAMLADACARCARPVVAIGGLQWQDAAIARSAGAHGMAVIGAWLRDGDGANSPMAARVALTRIVRAWQEG